MGNLRHRGFTSTTPRTRAGSTREGMAARMACVTKGGASQLHGGHRCGGGGGQQQQVGWGREMTWRWRNASRERGDHTVARKGAGVEGPKRPGGRGTSLVPNGAHPTAVPKRTIEGERREGWAWPMEIYSPDMAGSPPDPDLHASQELDHERIQRGGGRPEQHDAWARPAGESRGPIYMTDWREPWKGLEKEEGGKGLGQVFRKEKREMEWEGSGMRTEQSPHLNQREEEQGRRRSLMPSSPDVE